MDTRTAIDIVDKTFYVSLLIMSPLLGAGLIIGLIIAILQSITQVQEMTLSFVPKMIVVLFVMIWLLPWMTEKTMDFTVEVFNLIVPP